MYSPEFEAARGGGERGAEAEVDDGFLPASDPNHVDGARLALGIGTAARDRG